MPADWHDNWCINDQDLGGAAPLLIGPNLMFQSGKWGQGFLLDPNNLGGVNGQVFPAKSPYVGADVCFGAHGDSTFAAFAYAAPFVYVECEGSGIVALKLDLSVPSAPTFSPCDAVCAAPDWSAGGSTTFGPPIVAAGAVWAAGGGGLSVFDAFTGALIYQNNTVGIDRFVTPAEAGGQVFVGAFSSIVSFNMTVGTAQSGANPPAPRGAPAPSGNPPARTRPPTHPAPPQPTPGSR
jgi:hypothetical protein